MKTCSKYLVLIFFCLGMVSDHAETLRFITDPQGNQVLVDTSQKIPIIIGGFDHNHKNSSKWNNQTLHAWHVQHNKSNE